jgi:hypothetical protein
VEAKPSKKDHNNRQPHGQHHNQVRESRTLSLQETEQSLAYFLFFSYSDPILESSFGCLKLLTAEVVMASTM